MTTDRDNLHYRIAAEHQTLILNAGTLIDSLLHWYAVSGERIDPDDLALTHAVETYLATLPRCATGDK